MNKDDVIRMAMEAGWPDSMVAPIIMDKLADFAKVVAAAEREACAEVAGSLDPLQDGAIGRAIRARSQS